MTVTPGDITPESSFADWRGPLSEGTDEDTDAGYWLALALLAEVANPGSVPVRRWVTEASALDPLAVAFAHRSLAAWCDSGVPPADPGFNGKVLQTPAEFGGYVAFEAVTGADEPVAATAGAVLEAEAWRQEC